MPPVIGAITAGITAVATYVGAAVGGFVASVTGSIALGGYVSTALFYGTELAIYAGLSLLTVPKVIKPEGGVISLKQSVPPRRRGFGMYRTGGPYVLWEAKEDFALNVIAVHDGEIESFESFFLNDDPVTLVGDTVQEGADGRYPPPQVKIQYRLGLPTETNYSDLTAKLPTIWPSTCRGDGVASIFLSCQNGKAVHQYRNFPNGEPQVSAVIKAQKCFDPREVGHDESDPSTWEWSANPVLALLTYLMRERGYCYDWTADEVDTFNTANWNRRFGNTIAYWSAAADVCDEAVSLDAGGTEPRYSIGGQYTLDEDETAVVNTLLTSFDGWLTTDGQGGFIISAGKFEPPTVTLTEVHIKSVSVQLGQAIENQVNEIDISYTDPGKNYNTAEADPWIDETAILAAGKPRSEQLDLPWVQSFTQARRLAKRRMERHQAVCRGTMTVSLAAQAIFGQRFLTVNYPVIPILDGLIIEVTGNLQIDLSRLEITFPWTSVDPDARDGWTPATDEGSAPPPVDGSGAEALDPPTIDTASAWYVDGGSGGAPRLILGVTGPDRADLAWEARWRVDGLTDWSAIQHFDDIEDYPSATLRTDFVTAADSIEVQVRYQTGGGLFSDWSASAFVDTNSPTLTADTTTLTADTTVYTADAAP